jgi:hypothetical protein
LIIDGHSHVTLPVQEHIKAMDAAKIDKTIYLDLLKEKGLCREALKNLL